MPRQACQFTVPHQHTVTLSVDRKIGRDDRHIFSVAYGAESKSGLTHEQAASVLGFALMHAMECNGFKAE